MSPRCLIDKCELEPRFYLPEEAPRKNKSPVHSPEDRFLCAEHAWTSDEVFYPIDQFFIDVAENTLRPAAETDPLDQLGEAFAVHRRKRGRRPMQGRRSMRTSARV